MPDAVVRSIEEELSGLPPDALCLLRAAAVEGDPFEVDFAAAIAGLAEQAAMDALDEALARGLFCGTGTPRRFEFRHPIVRRAVYRSAGDGWRLGAHARAAEVLAEAGRPAASIAPHVERSAKRGDQAAIELLSSAGDVAAPRAPATAARWYAAALRLAGGADAAPGVRVPLLVAASSALSAQGLLNEGRERLAEAIAALEAEDKRLRVTLVARLAGLDAQRGHSQDARRVLLDAFAFTAPSSSERAALMLEIAMDRWRAGEAGEAVREGRDALALSQSLGDRALIGRAAAVVSLAATQGARMLRVAEDHRALAEEALDRVSDGEIAEHLDGLTYLSWSSGGLGHCRASIRHAQRGLGLSRANGMAYLFGPLTVTLGLARLRVGEIEQAERDAEEALESALLLGTGPHLVWALTLGAWVALERDDLRMALRKATDAARLLQDSATGGLACFFTSPVLAEACLSAEFPERARDQLLAGGPQLDNLPPNRHAWRLRLLAQAEVALGRHDAARARTNEAERSAAELQSPEASAHAAWARALCALADDAPADAASAALHAAGQLDELGLPLDAADARIVAARALLAAREHDHASELLAAVHSDASTLGAARLARLSAQEARRLRDLRGDSQRTFDRASPRPAGIALLTTREHEVVDLIVQGCSNREIAAELQLSIRTIETYVSRVLDKLGVSSRAAIAARASGQNLPRATS